MASNILTKIIGNIWIAAVILVFCVIASIYYYFQPPESILNIFGNRLSQETSRPLTVAIIFVLGILIAFLINIITGHLQKEKTVKEVDYPKPTFVVPVPKVEIVIPPQSDNKPAETPALENKKFYPNHFLPDLRFFVGRTEVLQSIKETLATDHRAAIHDISGLGKTFTSYKFAADNEDNYNKIFFILATKEEMLESLARCGEMVDRQLANVQEQKEKALGFKRWLEENEKWLVIYDNVDKPNELHPYIPVNKNGDCLFTSNFREVIQLGTNIPVDKLNETDAGILLYSRATSQPHNVPGLEGEEKVAFDKLIADIDGLPLTLNSIGARIFEDQSNFADFRQQYQQQPEIAWDSEDDYSPYQRKSAGKVFAMTYGELCQAKDTGEAVTILLNGMSFISPDEIPEELLQQILSDTYAPYANSKNSGDFWTKLRKSLTGYDLLKYDKDKRSFTTHRAIQRVIQTLLEPEQIQRVCAELSGTLLNLFPRYDYSNRPACEKYHQHVQTLLENSDNYRIENEDSESLYDCLARYQELLGNYPFAEIFYLRSLEISAQVSGTEHPDYVSHLNNLAIVYQDQGRYDEAIAKFEEALTIDEKTIGKEHPNHAKHLSNLATVYTSQQRYDEAIAKFEEALNINEKIIGKEHPNYATNLNNLALVYQNLGRNDEATAKFEEALRIGEKTIGKEHPNYAIRLNNLAIVYQSQGRYSEAIEKYKEALRIGEKTIGREHPDYATRLNNLAGVYEVQGKYKDALELFIKALEIRKKTLPENHRYLIGTKESVERCRAELKSA